MSHLEVMVDLVMDADVEADDLIINLIKRFPKTIDKIKELKIATPWNLKILNAAEGQRSSSIWQRATYYGFINNEIAQLPGHKIYKFNDSYQAYIFHPERGRAGGGKIFREFNSLEEAQRFLDQQFEKMDWFLLN